MKQRCFLEAGKGGAQVRGYNFNSYWFQLFDLLKFVMCTLVSWVHITIYVLAKGYTVPGNQSTHAKLKQNQKIQQH